MPFFIDRLKSRGQVITDLYKVRKPELPTHGAAVVVFVVFFVNSLLPVLTRILKRLELWDYEFNGINEIDIAILLVISIFGLFGIFDDLINLGWWSKIFFPVFFSFPLIVVFPLDFLLIPGYDEFELSREIAFGIEYSDIFKVFVVPVYIMVVSNLINMHSGFNGLQCGLSAILLFTVITKCILDANNSNILIPTTFLGGIVSFWFYNKYPSRIFEGNIGPLVFGACIGTLIVIKGLFIFGIFILLPHIVDFVMFMYLKVNGKPFIKFGELRKDGTLKVPNPFKMKFLLPYYFRLSEKEVVHYLYGITILFCFTGLIIF